MRRGYGRPVRLLLLAVLAVTGVVAPQASAEPGCAVRVAVRPVTVTVDGEPATGRVYEPYRCAEGDTAPRGLVVAVHGHDNTSADFADYLGALVRRTETPLLSMDMRSADSVWRTGDWNLRAGRDDVLAATRRYREEHPSIARTVLWGWSQGGATSGLAAASAPPGLFDYWVDAFGPADDFTAWARADRIAPDLRGQIERDAGGCPPVACPQAYADRSPALQAHKIEVRRAFMVHGTADSLVPYENSLEMRAALTAAGRPTSLYTIATGTDLSGTVVPGDHGVGPPFFESGCVVECLLGDTEPIDGGNRDYLIDIARDITTAPPPPPAAKCAA
ncbi:alpha/beta hydrolase family protein [Nocardia thraciensis]